MAFARPVRRNRRGRWCSQPPARGAAAGDWYMDYRNADGSVAEMCGNGVRVFAHYLRAIGLEGGAEFVVATLAGPRPVIVHDADDYRADVTVEMGKGQPARPRRRHRRRPPAHRSGRVDVGNPHLACVVPGLTADGLATLDVGAPVEFDDRAVRRSQRRGADPAAGGSLSMRARAGCGRNPVLRHRDGGRHRRRPADQDASTGSLRVRVPGGEVSVEITDTTSFCATVDPGRSR